MVELKLKGTEWCKVLFENKIIIEIKLFLEMRECRIYLHPYSISSSSDVGFLAKTKSRSIGRLGVAAWSSVWRGL